MSSYKASLQTKKGKIVTPDLGGSASTMEMAEAIVDELKGGI